MDYGKILNTVHTAVKCIATKGTVNASIPALARVSPDKLGIALKFVSGEEYYAGDAIEKFSIQSIAKVISLTLCLQTDSDILTTRVGIEPSGSPFNSLVQLETDEGIPRNPFINAGSLVILDSLISRYGEQTKQVLLDFSRNLALDNSIDYDNEIAISERETGFRDIALANFIKSYQNMHNPVVEVLDAFAYLSSLRMSCVDLTRTFIFLANGGKNTDGSLVLSKRQTKKVNSMLLTCGTYDAVGNFAYKVGLPAKSGSGGGIVTVLPGEFVLTVWAPGLDNHGNSLLGTKLLELFTTITGRSIF